MPWDRALAFQPDTKSGSSNLKGLITNIQQLKFSINIGYCNRFWSQIYFFVSKLFIISVSYQCFYGARGGAVG
jgi:hypothetical protein